LEVDYPGERDLLGVGFVEPPCDFSEDVCVGLICVVETGSVREVELGSIRKSARKNCDFVGNYEW
jgi:hypothetical protein